MPAHSESPSSSFARTVQAGTGQVDRLQRGVELVVELVDGCDDAGVTITTGQAVRTAAATGQLPRRGDALQYELGEGPCLDTVRTQLTVISPDQAVELRWSRWTPKVRADLGINAMMSLLLFTERDSLGALNLYAKQPQVWTGHSIAVAHALADQLAAALADAREIENRGRAMIGRTIIGQAQGILMERFGIDAEQAFAYLRRISQDSNRKLAAVADDVVRSRQLPAAGDR